MSSKMRAFTPHKLPPTGLDWERLSQSIAQASAAISVYNGLLKSIPNPHILLSPITTQEAVLSSRIEGTQASLVDVFSFEAGESYSREKGRDIAEIMNYRKALFRAEELFERIPAIHLNMLKELHAILLAGVRGENRARGEFRSVQNYIGRYSATIEQASYIPPSPDKVLPAMDAWEKYINSDGHDALTQLAVLHAQFEIIHPFLDGNGRLGRIFIPLFLYQKKMLEKPVFYLSQYFEEHRDEYYARLRAVTRDDDWQGWILFFLEAIIEQARTNTQTAEALLNLYEKTKTRMAGLSSPKNASAVLDALFFKPIMNTSEFMKKAGLKYKSTALDILKKLETAGVVETVKEGRGRAAAVFAFPELINTTEGRTVYLGKIE